MPKNSFDKPEYLPVEIDCEKMEQQEEVDDNGIDEDEF
jgi:hypothetical protein